jgi:hypothetical protein
LTLIEQLQTVHHFIFVDSSTFHFSPIRIFHMVAMLFTHVQTIYVAEMFFATDSPYSFITASPHQGTTFLVLAYRITFGLTEISVKWVSDYRTYTECVN